MGKGKRYDQEYKDMIVDLYKSGMSLAELSSEYGIARSTINGWYNRKRLHSSLNYLTPHQCELLARSVA